jgi:hypothetical protein
MLAATVCAVLCGCRGYRAIAQWIHLQDVSLWHALGFLRTPPTRNTFREVLMCVDPCELEQALWKWVTEALGLELSEDDLQAISLDGKTLRGSVLENHQGAVHVLTALDQLTGSILGQFQVDSSTNEHKAALQMLKTLVLKSRVVVADAMFCQREVCQQIMDSGGDYLVIVKDNQPALKQELQNAFAEPSAFSPLCPAVIA